MTTDTNIPQLVFNKMSNAKYEELKAAGQLVDTEFYVTPDNSQTLPTVDTTTADKVLSNDGTNMLWTNIEFPEPELGYKQLTNCITKIPQNIKLELNNGTLTLKAGSTVYEPSNLDYFPISVIEDAVVSTTNSSGKCFVYLNNQAQPTSYMIDHFSAGSTAPTEADFRIWYDTENGYIKRYNNGAQQDQGSSFPIAIVTIENNAVTSIDQIFNDFGYIDNIIFALPGIEGLAPNSRNDDLSLNNVKFTTTVVSTVTVSNAITSFGIKVENNGANVVVGTYDDFEKYFDENTNVVTYNNVARQWMKAGNVTVSNGTITEFSTKNPVSVLDRNDSSWVAEQAMPSNKYIDLTLGASNTTYTAPANGLIVLNKSIVQNTSAPEFINIYVNDILRDKINSALSHQTCLSSLVKKGDIIQIQYTATGATNMFRFIYAQGEV